MRNLSQQAQRADRSTIISAAVAVAAAAFACGMGLKLGTYAAADTDPYGYVSQADLLAGGSTRIALNPERFPPIPGNEAAWAPAGYVVAADHRSVVPMYPAGLPLVMAFLQLVAGDRSAVFWVVPLLAAVAVLATYALGARCESPTTGAIAAVVLATSPAFLNNTLQPVSDVPATAWWTVALVLALGDAPLLVLAGGLAVSMAVLTRPHLVPIGFVIGVFLIVEAWSADVRSRPRHWWKVACFALGSAPGCLAVAVMNQTLYTSPFLSGYGALGDLFRWEHVVPNLDRYPRWLLETQSAFPYVGLLAPLVVRWRVGRTLDGRSLRLLLACVGVVFVLTILYGYFGRDEWGYVRFLLPAMPSLLVLSTAVTQRLVVALLTQPRVYGAAIVALTAALAVWQLRETDRRGVFGLQNIERRYLDVGTFIANTKPGNAVFISGLHSGSIRYYSDRVTVYYPRLRQGSLDLAIRTMQSDGREVFIVLEDGELAAFAARFETSPFARLDWPPAHRTFHGVPVSIWNPRDRAAFLAGTPLVTAEIPPGPR
jgi:hypothetical protein